MFIILQLSLSVNLPNHLIHHPIFLVVLLLIEESAATRVTRLEMPDDDDTLVISAGEQLAVRRPADNVDCLLMPREVTQTLQGHVTLLGLTHTPNLNDNMSTSN